MSLEIVKVNDIDIECPSMNYLKFGIVTSETNSFANISGEEVRFWVIERSTIT
ncbi:MAG: hypothetical protein IPO86_10090 [Saprospiraceae bacterium]|nr:hypothetical protein [Saprospiraceae bacterium]